MNASALTISLLKFAECSDEVIALWLHLFVVPMIIGGKIEGLRLVQLYLIVPWFIVELIWLTSGSMFVHSLAICGIWTTYLAWKYGESDYSRLKVSGPYKVGVIDFKSKRYGN